MGTDLDESSIVPGVWVLYEVLGIDEANLFYLPNTIPSSRQSRPRLADLSSKFRGVGMGLVKLFDQVRNLVHG
jgi:hypothetical protein